MKKNVFILSALCFAAMTLVFSGCKKENNDPQEPAKVQTYQMSIQASKGADSQANGPRRVISLGGGGTLNAAWENGDQVTVRNVTKSADLDGQLAAENDGVNTQLNGTLTGAVSVGDELLLKYQTPNNYADQDGTLEYISANCDYATATVAVATVEGGAITANADAVFENQQAIVKFTLKNEDGSATIDAKPLVIEVAGETYTITPASATSEMYVALPGFASQNITFTATVGSDTYKKEVASVSLTNGEFYQITVEMTKQTAPAYKEYGPFSVSSSQRVNFSQGNLKYTKSTGKFEFMTNQYDMVETNNQDVGTDYASQDVVSLFGWATSNINEPANTYYYPWETDDSEGNRAKYGSGITSGDVNWATAHANYDWGANTGDLGTGWRTLTKDEWVYLFNTRIVNGGTGNGKSYTVGKSVNGTKGVVLYPDNYTGATYTGSDWSTFEDAGCVFLPVAGLRSGTSVSEVGSEGYYWSSTSNSSENAYIVYFVGGNAEPDATSSFRNSGLSVRLVKNAN